MGSSFAPFLKGSGFPSETVETIAEAEEIQSSLLFGLIVTDEALAGEGIDVLRRIVASQPGVVRSPRDAADQRPQRASLCSHPTQVRMEIRSLILLDRPVRKELLLSAVQVAYTSRLKELQVRDAAAAKPKVTKPCAIRRNSR